MSEHEAETGAIDEEPDSAVQELLPRYYARRRADAARLEALTAAPEWEEIRIIGHNMRGSGTAYGLEAISEIGAALEEASSRQDVEALRSATEDLVTLLASA